MKSLLERALNDDLALTYGDVRLRTGYSDVMPDKVSLESKFSRNVGLKIPIVSAAMDTVTEHVLAIELAKLGGIGIIHRKFTPKEQSREVARVKHHLNGLIDKPVTVFENNSIEEVLKISKEKGYTFHSFPVLNSSKKLVGILSGNDFDFCDDSSCKVRNVMTPHPLKGKEGTTILQAYSLMKKGKKKALPLVDSQNRLTGMYVLSDVKRIITRSAVNYNLDEGGQLRVGAAIGTDREDMKRVELLLEENVDVLVIDTAHGDSKPVYDMLKEIKKYFPKVDVVVGNVSIGKSAKKLADEGADGIKVGQGPGSICTTRIVAGIGRPQVSAVYDCAAKVDSKNIPICADGGIENSGDLPIAIGAGAHSVMMGNVLAGTEESPGEIVLYDQKRMKRYEGMGSIAAMKRHSSSRQRYSQSGKNEEELISQGVEGLVHYKGPLSKIIVQFIGGLKDGMGYVGAETIEQLREKAEFDRITSAGVKESHPHGLIITHDQPNYRAGDRK